MGHDLFALMMIFYTLVYSPNLKGVCPTDMVYVPAGEFAMGSNIANQKPMRRLPMDAYCVDKYEYPNIKGEYPATDLNWEEAERACEEVGKRLCTEMEWEKACRGEGGYWYTYGKRYNRESCGTEIAQYGKLYPSGYFESCKSVYGVYDMSGSVFEWTADPYLPYPDPKNIAADHFNVREKAVRDFGYAKGKDSYCSNRKGISWSSRGGYLGFRCCLSFSEAKNEAVKQNIWDAVSRF